MKLLGTIRDPWRPVVQSNMGNMGKKTVVARLASCC